MVQIVQFLGLTLALSGGWGLYLYHGDGKIWGIAIFTIACCGDCDILEFFWIWGLQFVPLWALRVEDRTTVHVEDGRYNTSVLGIEIYTISRDLKSRDFISRDHLAVKIGPTASRYLPPSLQFH